jgi:hypothetical protein
MVGVVEEAGELAGADHAGLIHHQHRPGVQQRLVPGAAAAARVALLVELGLQPVDGCVQQPLLDLEQLGGGPAALPDRVLGHSAHTSFGQQLVGQLLQLGRADGGELAAQGDQDLAPGEGRGVGSEPVGTGQLIEHPPDGHAVRGELALAADHPAEQPLTVDAVLAGLVLPAAV